VHSVDIQTTTSIQSLTTKLNYHLCSNISHREVTAPKNIMHSLENKMEGFPRHWFLLFQELPFVRQLSKTFSILAQFAKTFARK